MGDTGAWGPLGGVGLTLQLWSRACLPSAAVGRASRCARDRSSPQSPSRLQRALFHHPRCWAWDGVGACVDTLLRKGCRNVLLRDRREPQGEHSLETAASLDFSLQGRLTQPCLREAFRQHLP